MRRLILWPHHLALDPSLSHKEAESTTLAVAADPPYCQEASWADPWPEAIAADLSAAYYWLDHYREIDALIDPELPVEQRYTLVNLLGRDLQTAFGLQALLKHKAFEKVLIGDIGAHLQNLVSGACAAEAVPLEVIA